MRIMAHMEAPVSPVVSLGHRRAAARLRTGLPARLTDVGSSYGVKLEDLSRTGARISVPASRLLHPGELVVLRWAGFERFGEIVWVSGNRGGIQFEEEVEDRDLIATRHLQDEYSRKGAELMHLRNVAREWVHGPRD